MNSVEIDLEKIQGKIYYMIASWNNLDVDIDTKRELLLKLAHDIAVVTIEDATKEIAVSSNVNTIKTKPDEKKSNNNKNSVWRSLNI